MLVQYSPLHRKDYFFHLEEQYQKCLSSSYKREEVSILQRYLHLISNKTVRNIGTKRCNKYQTSIPDVAMYPLVATGKPVPAQLAPMGHEIQSKLE
jgi:hypothetical protein